MHHDTDSASLSRVPAAWLIPFLALFIFFAGTARVEADWIDDGNAVSTSDTLASSVRIVSDGEGGVIIAWIGYQNGNPDIFAQRLDSLGNPLWDYEGGPVPVSVYSSTKRFLNLVPDRSGGAHVVWQDGRNGNNDIYSQKISASGSLSTVSGRQLTENEDSDNSPVAVPDGQGGVMITYDYHGSSPWVHPPEWAYQGLIRLYENGRMDYRRHYSTPEPTLHMTYGSDIVTSENDNFILICRDAYVPYIKYFRKVNLAGNVISWTSYRDDGGFGDGVTDGLGGMFYYYASEGYFYLNRFTGSLASDWETEYIYPGEGDLGSVTTGHGAVFSGPDYPGETGAMIFTWSDETAGREGLYAQRIDTDKVESWEHGGLLIGESVPGRNQASVVEDGDGGFYISWLDGEIRVNHVSRNGQLYWGSDGVSIRTDHGVDTGLPRLIPSESGGQVEDEIIFTAWTDDRGGEYDAYVTKSSGEHLRLRLGPIGDQQLDVGDTLRLTLTASSADTQNPIVFSTDAGDIFGSRASLDSDTGEFELLTQIGDQGDHYVRFEASSGAQSDHEIILLSIFNDNNRPPVIGPVEDVSVYAAHPALITVSATDPDLDDLTFTCENPQVELYGRSGDEATFVLWTRPGDDMRFDLVFTVDDGTAQDSTIMTVRKASMQGIHDWMSAYTSGVFDWIQSDGAWSQEEEGYFTGTAGNGWGDAVMTSSMFDSEKALSMVVRVFHDRNVNNYMFGFTDKSWGEDNLSYPNLDHGVYIHSSGSLRPSWDINNSAYWDHIIPTGYYDVLISIDGVRDRVAFSIDQVGDWSSPQADFLDPVWRIMEDRSVRTEHGLLLLPQNQQAKIYDVWMYSPVNHRPVLERLDDLSVDTGSLLEVRLSAYDYDPYDDLVFGTDADLVLPGGHSFDTSSGVFRWTPQPGEAGDYDVTFSVTDGTDTDSETIIISVFEDGNRPPVILSVEGSTAFVTTEVVLVILAEDPDSDTMTYSVDDARFTGDEHVFRWTAGGNEESFDVQVTVSDGRLDATETVTVNILPLDDLHDPMAGYYHPGFDWLVSQIEWHEEDGGYLSGDGVGGGWSSAIGSAPVDGTDTRSFITRFKRGSERITLGFTPFPPGENDFSSFSIRHGLYVNRLGIVAPSWDRNNIAMWDLILAPGLYDLYLELGSDAELISFALEEVGSADDPISDFTDPLWAAAVGREAAGDLYYQLNPEGPTVGVYDVWKMTVDLGELIPAGSPSIESEGGAITVSWSMDGGGEGVSFVVARSEEGGVFENIEVSVGSEGSDFSFTDSSAEPGMEYSYRVVGVRGDISVLLFVTDSAEPVPALTELFQNYPNPFNPVTRITYHIASVCEVSLDIYDVAGRHVASLVRDRKDPGIYTLDWPGTGRDGEVLGSGVYFYRLRAGSEVFNRKLVILR